tara:strand:- start:182 stop:490 length:309 start_codon:yes stop_codon:yes gene_type:complete
MKYIGLKILFTLIISTFIACAAVGKPFNESRVSMIVVGKTLKEDVQNLFGKPFRSGIENSNEVWIYEYNAYSIFEKESLKDLIVVFDKEGRVLSHQIMSSSQ